jgi:hypothetical protein
LDGGEGDTDFGYLEDAFFSCSSQDAYASDEAVEAAHPLTDGFVEISRYTALNRWVFDKYGPSPSLTISPGSSEPSDRAMASSHGPKTFARGEPPGDRRSSPRPLELRI